MPDGGSGGDPHFVGFNNQLYDVMAAPGFWCLLTSANLHVNAHFIVLDNGFTIIDQIGLMLPGTGIYFDLALESGRQVVPCNHEVVRDYKVIDPGIGSVRGGIFVLAGRTVVHTGTYILEVVYCCDHGKPHPRYGKLDRPHLDLYVHTAGNIIDLLPTERPHGLIGVSSLGGVPKPDGLNGEGVIDADGSVLGDYAVSGLWQRDCKVNRYHW